MRILNFGSLNIDYVYNVDHFVRPGETISSTGYNIFPGGKGANQSTALGLAGADVAHAGKIGKDGAWYVDKLKGCGVDTSFIDIINGPSGHAIIEVNKEGENSIILFGGANRMITPEDADRVLLNFSKGDILLLQNEISSIPEILKKASMRGLTIVLNPAPMHPDVLGYPLELIDIFIVNEIEGAELSGEKDADKILDAMIRKYPTAKTVLTLGSKGAAYAEGSVRARVHANKIKAVDTTAAGDTFIGYFLAELALGRSCEDAMNMGCKAAEICITRPGAASSIPRREEIR